MSAHGKKPTQPQTMAAVFWESTGGRFQRNIHKTFGLKYKQNAIKGIWHFVFISLCTEKQRLWFNGLKPLAFRLLMILGGCCFYWFGKITRRDSQLFPEPCWHAGQGRIRPFFQFICSSIVRAPSAPLASWAMSLFAGGPGGLYAPEELSPLEIGKPSKVSLSFKKEKKKTQPKTQAHPRP